MTSLVVLVALDAALVLAERLDDLLVDEDAQGQRLRARRRVQNLVPLQPLPEVGIERLLQVSLVLDGVLDVPRVHQLALRHLLHREVEIDELLWLGNNTVLLVVVFSLLSSIKVDLCELVEHLVRIVQLNRQSLLDLARHKGE